MLKNGQLTAKSPSEKAWAISKNAARELTGKKMPDDKFTAGKDDHEMADAMSMMAAYNLRSMIEGQTGKQLDGAFLDNASTIVGNYSGAAANSTQPFRVPTRDLNKVNFSARKSTGGANGAGKARTKRTKRGQKAQIPPEVKQEAAGYAKKLGINPNSSASAHTMEDIEAAFAHCMKGAKSDKDLALNALRYVDQQTGGANGNFTKYAQQILSTTDNPQIHAQMREVALQKLSTMAAAGPEAYAALQAQQLAATAAGGGGFGPTGLGPGMGGMPPGGMIPGQMMPGQMGPGGFGGPNVGHPMDNARAAGRQIMTASILLDPSLSTQDKVMLVLMLVADQANDDRMRKMQEIADMDRMEQAKKMLKDFKMPKLSGATRGRLDKMKEKKAKLTTATDIEGLKNKDGMYEPKDPKDLQKLQAFQRSETVKDLVDPETGQFAPKNEQEAARVDAYLLEERAAGLYNTETNQFEPKTDEDKAIVQDFVTHKTALAQQAQLTQDVNQGQGPHPAGPDGMGQSMDTNVARAQGEMPKSREVLMAELDRLSKVYDNIFQALKSVLDKYDETQRGVKQSMDR